jgi:calcineurin-like phosphoesterase family protein
MAPPLKAPFFVTSDSHWFHERIVEFAGRPYDHERMMITRWTRTVGPSDTVLHLGDLFFGGPAGYERFKEELTPVLTGKKYLILGNHDRRKWDYEALGFTVLKPFSMPYRGYTVHFGHYPSFPKGYQEIQVHGHIHRNGYARGEMTRPRNINVSVEVTEYRPRRITRLLNHYISAHKNKRQYVNSRHYRNAKSRRGRRQWA